MEGTLVRILFHGGIFLIIFSILFFKNELRKRFNLKNCYFKNIESYFKIKFNFYQIFLSILLIFIIDFLIIILSGKFWNPQFSDIYGFILGVFIIPINEEFIFRGIVLGLIFIFLIPDIFKKISKKDTKNIILYKMLTLIFVSFFFSIVHHNPKMINFIIRFTGGLVYGILYLICDKNLVPPVLAHTTHNILAETGFFIIF